jgi:sugar phosphate permease
MPNSTPTNVRWLVLALGCGASWVLYLHRYTFGVIMPFLGSEYGWSKETLGGLAGAFSTTYALGQVPSGMLCDWFGPHVFVGSIVLAWSAGLAATTVVGTLGGFYAVRLYFGLTQAGCYPGLGKLTRSWIPLGYRTTAQGLIASFSGRAGAACSNILFATVLLGLCGLSWRGGLLVFAAVGAIFAAAFLLLVRNSPSEHPWSNAAEQQLVDRGERESSATMVRSVLPWRQALSNGNLQIFLVQQFAAAYVDQLYVFWLVTFLLEAKDFDITQAGLYASLPLWGGAAGGMFAGFFQDVLIRRTGSRRWVRRLVGFFGCAGAAALVLLALRVEDGRWVMMVLGVVKFFADWSQPTTWGTATDLGGRYSGTVFALVNTAGSLGGIVAPYLMGLTVSHFTAIGGVAHGWVALFVHVSLVYAAAAVAWLFIDCTRPVAAGKAETDPERGE